MPLGFLTPISNIFKSQKNDPVEVEMKNFSCVCECSEYFKFDDNKLKLINYPIAETDNHLSTVAFINASDASITNPLSTLFKDWIQKKLFPKKHNKSKQDYLYQENSITYCLIDNKLILDDISFYNNDKLHQYISMTVNFILSEAIVILLDEVNHEKIESILSAISVIEFLSYESNKKYNIFFIIQNKSGHFINNKKKIRNYFDHNINYKYDKIVANLKKYFEINIYTVYLDENITENNFTINTYTSNSEINMLFNDIFKILSNITHPKYNEKQIIEYNVENINKNINFELSIMQNYRKELEKSKIFKDVTNIHVFINGSRDAEKIITDRYDNLVLKEEEIYKKTFCNVTTGIKNYVFEEIINSTYNIINSAKQKNIELALNLIQPKYNVFMASLTSNNSLLYIREECNTFIEKIRILLLDSEAISEYINIINIHMNEYENIIKMVEKNNRDVKDAIVSDIKYYNVPRKTMCYLQEIINNHNEQKIINEDFDNIFEKIKKEIFLDIKKIIIDHDLKFTFDLDEKTHNGKISLKIFDKNRYIINKHNYAPTDFINIVDLKKMAFKIFICVKQNFYDSIFMIPDPNEFTINNFNVILYIFKYCDKEITLCTSEKNYLIVHENIIDKIAEKYNDYIDFVKKEKTLMYIFSEKKIINDNENFTIIEKYIYDLIHYAQNIFNNIEK